ncbi:MAG: ABC transporter permease [Streptosporangiales bacterium]
MTAGESTAQGAALVRVAAGRRWYESRNLVIGLALLAAIGVLAAFAPYFTGYNPTGQHIAHALEGPSGNHLLGTDRLGRDVWSRLVYAARIDLAVAVSVEVIPFCIGITLGCLAGYYGGVLDTIVSRAADVVMAFPFYVLIIAFVFMLGTGVVSIFVTFTIISWVWYARLIRSEVLVAKQQEYVVAARSAGFSGPRIILRHIMPNVITQAYIFSMSDIVLNILGIVTLGFLGLGIQPPTPEWGQMISDGQEFMSTHWMLATLPGVAVVITGLALSLIGDGLADWLRPESR